MAGHPRHPPHGGLQVEDLLDSENRLDRLLDVEDQMLRDSWSDSLWQTLVLAGVLEANPLLLTFFSYAVPTYFGMAVAVYEPGPSPTPP